MRERSGCSNGSAWIEYGNINLMRQQLPFSVPLLRRFHINLFTRAYTEDEFDKINRFITRNGANKPLYDRELLNDFSKYLDEARDIEIQINKIPEKVFSFLKNVKRMERNLITPITPELAKGVLEIAKANARIRLDSEITEDDWSHVVGFLIRTLEGGGLTHRLVNSLKKS